MIPHITNFFDTIQSNTSAVPTLLEAMYPEALLYINKV